jgi:hypothetical protein
MLKFAVISVLEGMSGFDRETGLSHAAQKGVGDFVAKKSRAEPGFSRPQGGSYSYSNLRAGSS